MKAYYYEVPVDLEAKIARKCKKVFGDRFIEFGRVSSGSLRFSRQATPDVFLKLHVNYLD